MRSSISLGRILGIPVGVSYTWFIILALVSYIVFGQLSLQLPRWGAFPLVGLAGATGLLFFGSILAHELAHSVMATRHSLPVRGITLFLLGGVSHITRESRRPWTEFIVAFVGPLLSLLIGGVMLGIAFIVAPAFLTGRLREGVIVVTLLLGWTNLALGLFNLVPGFPLDGGRVLRAVVWGLTGNYWLATSIAVLLGQAFAVVLALGSVALFLRTGNLINLWPVMVSAFIFMAASSAKSAARDRRQLWDVTAGQVVSSEIVAAEMTIADAVNAHLMRKGRGAVLVGVDEIPVGVLHLRALRRLPRNVWSFAIVMQAMTPLSAFPRMDAGQRASDVMEVLEEDEGPPAVVVELDGQVTGILTRADLYAYMQLRTALNL